MAQLNCVGSHATSIRAEDGFIVVRYHDTDVVKFDKDFIILNTDGWFTPTTKNRMNQASNQFKLGFKIFQKDFTWFVELEGKNHIFNRHELILDR